MKIYVVVEVTYDYYRFERNVYVSTSKRKINKFLKDNFYNVKDDPWIIIWDENKTYDYDIGEDKHIWIQIFEEGK